MANDAQNDEERTICFCHNVSLARLKQAIAGGAHTLEQIQAETCASTGCGGCQYEVEEVLADETAKAAAGSSPSDTSPKQKLA